MSENASSEEIRKAFRNLAFRYHPDRSPGSEEMMKEINEAYAVLSNPAKKDEYDALRQRHGSFAREQFRQTHTDRDIFRDSDIGQIFEEFSKIFGFSRPEDIFSRDNVYGPRYRTFEFKGPGGSGGGFFFYGPIRRAFQEKLRVSPYQTPQPAGHSPFVLSAIMLRGLDLFQKLVAKKLGLDLPESGRDRYDVIEIAAQEAFAGGRVRYRYKKRGKPRDLLIKIPPGISDGQKMKLKGLGEEGKHGGKSGDLYLKVKVHTPFLEKIKKLLRK